MNMQSEAFSDTYTTIEVRKIKAGPPLSWIVDAFSLVREHWKVLLPAYLILTIGTILVQFGPAVYEPSRPGFAMFILMVVAMFVGLLLQAGLPALFHGAAEGQPRIMDAFRGFKGRNVLGVFLLMVMMILVMILFGGVVYLLGTLLGAGDVVAQMFGPYSSYGPAVTSMLGGTSLLAGFVFGGIVVMMALFCYALPLIVVAGQGVFAALRDSFRASVKNLLVLFIFGFNMTAVYFLAMIIPMIGGALSSSATIFLIVMAVFIWLFALVLNGAYYLSFRDVLLKAASKPEATVE